MGAGGCIATSNKGHSGGSRVEEGKYIV